MRDLLSKQVLLIRQRFVRFNSRSARGDTEGSDAAVGIASIWTPAVIWSVLAIGIAGGLANLGLRRPQVSEAAQSPTR